LCNDDGKVAGMYMYTGLLHIKVRYIHCQNSSCQTLLVFFKNLKSVGKNCLCWKR